MGPERGQAIMYLPESDPGALKWIKCPHTHTGKYFDPYRLFLVPIRLTSASNNDTNAHKTRTEGDATEATASHFDDGDNKAAIATTQVKTDIADEKTDADIKRIRIQELFADAKPSIRKLKEYEIMHDEWQNKCGTDAYKAHLVSDVDNTRPTLRRALAILIKIHKGDISANEREHTGSIMLLMDQLDMKHKGITAWAVTYGVHEARGNKRGSKRKTDE